METPTKLEFGINLNGCSFPIWHYKKVPVGMRRASLEDLFINRPVLSIVRIGPDKGDYYSGFVTGATLPVYRQMIDNGEEIYVKD